MNKKINNGLAIILPNKRINLFAIFILILGIISGSIFLIVLKDNDKNMIVEQFNTFRNALYENYIFIILVWLLGSSIIGIIVNIFLVYFKGFIYGFSLSSCYWVFKYKGLILSFIYAFPTIIINLIVVLILLVYSILFTSYLWKVIFAKDRNTGIKRFLKKYLFVLLICLVLGLVSSFLEAYLVPSMIKLVIKLFI